MKRQHIITGQRIDPTKLAQAKALRREMTPAEKVLWSRLRRNQLGYHFRRQQIIARFIADFYCDAARLVVEVDGGVHEKQADYDESRTEVFTQWGITILRVTNKEVLDKLEETLVHIKGICQARGCPSPARGGQLTQSFSLAGKGAGSVDRAIKYGEKEISWK